MAARIFLGTLDRRLNLELDVVVRDVGDEFGFFGDMVEFSHEEKGFEESPIDTGAVLK